MYVGQSIDISRRFAQHFRLLKRGANPCPELQAAFNRDGAEAFERRIVEECDAHALDAAEQRHLDAGFASGLLYNNATRAGWPPAGHQHSEAAREAAGIRRKAHFATHDGKARLLKALSSRSPEWREGVAARGRTWRLNDAFVRRHNEAMSARSESPEWRARMSERNERLKSDPAWQRAVADGHRTDAARANHGNATRAFWDRLRADPAAMAEHKRRISEGRRR
jgi:group I intron endonuclease